jgi:hypothetical protein
MVTSPGARFVEALAVKDTPGLLAVLAPDVVLRCVSPSRFWEADCATEAVHDVLYRWIEESDVVERVEAVEEGTVADRQRITYRLRVRNPHGLFLVEQGGYLDARADGRIQRMHLMCSGYRPIPEVIGEPGQA